MVSTTRRWWLAGVISLVVMSATVLDASARERRPAALQSYCGFGHESATSAAEPGGGGDHVVIDDPEGVYTFIYDSSSPVTLDQHDRVEFRRIGPAELRLLRVGDHLVICHDARRFELVLDSQYCRATAPSEADVPNNEIEELIFVDAAEIWLSDTLFDEWLRDPGRFPPVGGAPYEDKPASAQWQIRPFRSILPEAASPAKTCR